MFFHLFKRDIKKYSSFSEHLLRLDILCKVDELLTQFKDVDLTDMKVIQQNNAICITLGNNTETENESESYLSSKLDGLKNEQNESEIIEEEHVIEESLNNYFEVKMEIAQIENLNNPQESTELKAYESTSSRRSKKKNVRKYKYPINTNEKLSEEEKEWINHQVRNCEVVHDGLVIYKCPLCETFLQIPGSFKKHLRDCHVLKSEKDQDAWNSRRAFKDEIKKSRLTVETSYGQEIIWKCQRCESNRIFKSEAGLKVHIRYNHIRNQVIDAKFIAQCKTIVDTKESWKCPDCGKILKSRDGLRNHMKLEHPEIIGSENTNSAEKTINRTNHDNEGFNSILNLLEMNRRTLKAELFTNSCNECGINFISGSTRKEKSFQIHNQCHKILDVVSLYYQLPKCDVNKTMFSNEDDLNAFLQSDPVYFEPISCDGIVSKVSRKFKDSIGTAGNEVDAWRCGHCGVNYQTEVECISHVMILHSKKLICPIDHMEFEGNRGIGQFTIHMRNKHPELFPELVISCTYCQAEFASIFDKLAHMKTCDEKKFGCDHCSKKFYTKTELSRHLKLVSGEISYVCDICNKPCSSTMELKLHRTAHTNQKSYFCSYPQCDKAFKTPAARSSHMEVHSNVSHMCSFCSSSFRQRALLQRHTRKGFCRRSPKQRAKNQFENIIVYEENQMF